MNLISVLKRCSLFLPIVLLLWPVAMPAQQEQEVPQKRSLTLRANDIEYTIGVDVPVGWSVAAQMFENSRSLIDVGPEKRPSASVQIYLEPRLDHADALKQIREFASVVPEEDKIFTMIGGWPAARITRLEVRPQPSQGPRHEDPKVLRIQTYIAVDDILVVASGELPSNAKPGLIRKTLAIASSLEFESVGDPVEVEEDLQFLQGPVDSDLGPALPGGTQEGASIATPQVEMGAVTGANARISAIGRGEVEVAVSPDGVNVVVALQASRWVSSQDSGSTFSAPVAIGFGNGDPSAAWGQSANFYQAGIDTNCGFGTPAYQGITFPPGPAPSGYDCTGIARSTDNGVSFLTTTVNPAVVCIGRGVGAAASACFPDQEHIAADRVNAGTGGDQVYSTWRNFNFDLTVQDAGLVCTQDSAVTWTLPITLGASSFFPRITVGQDGFVYVTAWGGGFYRVWKYSSCANGLNLQLGFPVNVVARDPYDCPFAGHDRCDQNPSSQTVAVDDTNPNHIYLAYAQDAGAGSNSNVFVRDSLDGGLTWPIARVVQSNAAVDGRRIMPWMCTTGGDAVLTWYEQRAPAPSDTTDFFGGKVGLDAFNNLVSRSVFRISEVPDNWCDSGWDCGTRVAPSAAESCPVQPQLAGICGDNIAGTPDSGVRCDFSDESAVPGTYCPQPFIGSGNNEFCLLGNGCPKYGDYSGIACTGGNLFAAWASATSPPGVPPPNTATNTGVLFDVIDLSQNSRIIAIDKTGSMGIQTTACGAPMSRCECAVQKAEAFIPGIFADDPTVQVAVVAFGVPGSQSGEETLVQGFTNEQALVEAAVQGVCNAPNTQLADAACLSGDLLAAFPGGGSRFVTLLTDGQENFSDDECPPTPPGTIDTLGVPPFTPGSWQNNVWTNLLANAVVDVGFFGPIGPILLKGPLPDANLESAMRTIGPDEVSDLDFFQQLSSATGGQFTHFADTTAVVATPVDHIIPTLGEWGLVALILIILLSGVLILRTGFRS
jgi:hypothetical protein